MQLKESQRKYILIGIFIFIIIGLVIAKVMAKQQDEQFLSNELLFQQAQQLYINGDYEAASVYINELLKEQPDSEIVNYTGGLIAVFNGDFNHASILFQKTLDINPHKVEDPIFMLQFGETLYRTERYEDALVVLARCQEAGWTPEQYPNYQEKVNELLTSIENLK